MARIKLTDDDVKILGLLEELGEWNHGNWPPFHGGKLRGWIKRGLILVQKGGEGPGRTSVFRVNPDWKKREDIYDQIEAIRQKGKK